MKPIYLALCLCMLLAGCATAYKSPQGTGLAQIRYVNGTSGFGLDAFTFGDDQCNDPVLIGALHKRKYPQEDGIARRGMPLFEGLDVDRVKEIAVAPGRPFVSHLRRSTTEIVTSQMQRLKTCRITFSFVPEREGLYEVVYRETGNKCFIEFYRIEKDVLGNYAKVEDRSAIRRPLRQCNY